MNKRHLFLAALATTVTIVGCGSGSTSSFGNFFGAGTGGNNPPNTPGQVTLRFDSKPPGVDSIQAVFLDAGAAPIGEPFEVPVTGTDFVIENPPANFQSLEIDYLRNGGYALFESFHQRGTKTTLGRMAVSPTSAPQLQAAPPQRSKWAASVGPAAFHLEASGNPGADRPAEEVNFKVRGVGYSPAPIGFSNQDGPGLGDLFWDGGQVIPGAGTLLDWEKVWRRDLESIRPRFNAVRLYSMIAEHLDGGGQFANPPVERTHQKFLDACWNNGNKPIYVLVGVPMPSDCFLQSGNPARRADFERVLTSTLAETGDHPAVMGYTFFNEIGGSAEWGGSPGPATFYWTQVQKYSQQIKTSAPDKLCGFAYFDAPGNASTANAGGYLAQYGGSLDFWGVNAFQGTTTVNTLAPYKALTAAKKPVLFTEFGVPATGHSNTAISVSPFPTQAGVNSIFADSNTIHLAAEAMRNVLPGTLSDDIVGGMFYFEWCDEYWKQPSEVPHYTTTKDGQEGGTVAATSQMPNGFNDEEGFGLNSISLNGRPIGALFDPFNRNAATANNRPDTLTPRSELLEAVSNAYKPIR